MDIRRPTDDEHAMAKAMGYGLSSVSTDGLWFIGTKPVMYGVRAIAWHRESVGPSVDYCAGSDAGTLSRLLIMLERIFSFCLDEGASERTVTQAMPPWERRPVNTDPACWKALHDLAGLELPTSEEIRHD